MPFQKWWSEFFFSYIIRLVHDESIYVAINLDQTVASVDGTQRSKNVMKMAFEHSDFLFLLYKDLDFCQFKVFYT